MFSFVAAFSNVRVNVSKAVVISVRILANSFKLFKTFDNLKKSLI